MKMAVLCQVLRSAGEHGSVDETGDVFGRDIAVAELLIDTGIDGHDAIERTGV